MGGTIAQLPVRRVSLSGHGAHPRTLQTIPGFLVMPRNEAQTRFEMIDPALENWGWDRRTDVRVEETAKPIDIVHHQARERAAGRTDNLLRRPLTPVSSSVSPDD